MTHYCPQCRLRLPIENFYLRSGGANNYCSYCIPCSSKQRKEYYQKNRTKEMAAMKKWQAVNPEKVKDYREKYKAKLKRQ